MLLYTMIVCEQISVQIPAFIIGGICTQKWYY